MHRSGPGAPAQLNLLGMAVRLKADPPRGSRLASAGLRAGAVGHIEDIAESGAEVRFGGDAGVLWVSLGALEIALDESARAVFSRIAKAAKQ
jgi:hypothetical protein